MKVFVTGGTGFIGGRVARSCASAATRCARSCATPRRASRLDELGCELVAGDLGDVAAIRSGHGGLRRRDPRRSRLRGRDPEVRAPRRCTRRTWPAPRTSSAPRSRPRSRRSSTSRPSARSATPTARSSTRRYEHPGSGVHLLLRADEVRGAPDRQAADRRGGPAVRDRPARRRLRARRPFGHRHADRPVPRREDARPHLPRPRLQHGPRGRRRRRDPARSRRGQGGRGLRPRRRDHDDARPVRDARPTSRTASHRDSPFPPAS